MKIRKFIKYLRKLGEGYIGKPNKKYIEQIFKTQGYYSGIRYRVYYSKKKGFTHEERNF
ncbi:MAG: hypothetical protein PF513_03110 [Tenericutes bacterium]|jgi:hypothetical protein|nr:hypothetical protein [Mycoplasmatota bacterium]